VPRSNGKPAIRVRAAEGAVAFVYGGRQYDVVEAGDGRYFEVPADDPELLEALRRHGHLAPGR
jgi:hypothetical protein